MKNPRITPRTPAAPAAVVEPATAPADPSDPSDPSDQSDPSPPWQPIDDQGPKFQRVVEVRKAGVRPVMALRRPEGWYSAVPPRLPLAFLPAEWREVLPG